MEVYHRRGVWFPCILVPQATAPLCFPLVLQRTKNKVRKVNNLQGLMHAAAEKRTLGATYSRLRSNR
ncbi:uncharacterized protein BO66DRAFT_123498 [Aspergillus aculeatinus CBS 121060]|uniref:Uncharacterized protein n=1 Tax=Aspergillus aculeatinus CBS 121060 TaxID=1448322 RepID=A0ACD1H4W4_9EURO|nr:hypothetical protein BO66DRAFT_123498 [Aspergillus aculeatinus CBS 121060]RAH68647.1 hypothetical protein BO66DRAFT_123498 [Aspergillus aculeatinus CBS 121060]